MQVADSVESRILPKQEAFRVLKQILNFSSLKIENARLKHDTFLDYYLCESHLECHGGFLRVDNYYVKVLTLKEPSARTIPLILKSLLEVQANFEGKKLPESFRKPSVNVGQLLDDALGYSKRNKKSYNTDFPRIACLKAWFGSDPEEELAPKQIEKRHADVAYDEEWAASTFNHYRSLMSLSYGLGIQNRKVSSNPARSVTHRREDNNRVRFLTEEEEKNLRKVIDANWASHMPELDLAINTGIRKGSQYALTWDMVDWKSRELHIPNTETKNGEPLHVPLNDAAMAALKVAFAAGNGEGRVFKSKKTGDPLENGRHWFEDAVVEAKVKNFHWHDLRDTFASRRTRIWVRTSCIEWYRCSEQLSPAKTAQRLISRKLL